MEDNKNINKNIDNNIDISLTSNKSLSTSDTSINNNAEINLDSFIEKMTKKLSILYKVYLTGKRLYYFSSEGDIIYFIIEICQETDINPFNENLLLDLQFIPKKKPFLTFRKDCFIPSFCDNRNLIDCFIKKDFVYNNNLDEVEKLMEEIINIGIKNFLFCIKENFELSTFIYYGDYELNEFYNINDFIINEKTIKFYRINHIYENNDIEEKYIIITQLYFLILTPKKNDKSFGYLDFKEKLHDMNFNFVKAFNNKLKKYTLKLIFEQINKPINNLYEIEFFFIERSCPINNELYTEENNEEQINKINTEPPNEEKIFLEKYSKFKEEINKKQKEINLSKYNSLIRICSPLFHVYNKNKKLNEFELKNKIIDYEKLFQYCEKNYERYNKLNKQEKEKYKDRIEFYLVAINYLGAELMTFYDKEKVNFNFYYNKIRSILNSNENEQ